MHAARNIALCTKDCVCLFICPTGATDTENGQVDFSKCLDGCRLCVDACPSHALYLVPSTYPKPQPKTEPVKTALLDLAQSKADQESLAKQLAKESDDPIFRQLCKTVEMSNRIMAEDCYREAGYILPQSDAVRQLLKHLVEKHAHDETFPKDAAEALLAKL
jgi:Fe-S-cluster-containing hydrogenase component 2